MLQHMLGDNNKKWQIGNEIAAVMTTFYAIWAEQKNLPHIFTRYL